MSAPHGEVNQMSSRSPPRPARVLMYFVPQYYLEHGPIDNGIWLYDPDCGMHARDRISRANHADWLKWRLQAVLNPSHEVKRKLGASDTVTSRSTRAE